MIDPDTRARILELIAMGWPDTQIAEACGVGRKTVGRIRAHPEPPVNTPRAAPRKGKIISPRKNARATWCDVCGAPVQKPCVVCQVRAMKPDKPLSIRPDASPKLEMEGEGLERYLKLRTKREGKTMTALDEMVEAARWDGSEPEGQGLPDGETWARYQHAMQVQAWVNELKAGGVTDLCKMLFKQAKLCRTASGGGLLLAIKGHLEGREVYEGCSELWQVADDVGRKLERLEAAELAAKVVQNSR